MEDDLYPVSILDTDLYKLTMQQAIMKHFPDVEVSYKFTNRSKEHIFSKACVDRVNQILAKMRELRLTPTERKWLSEIAPYFEKDYLDYLSQYRFDPSQVTVTFLPERGDLTIDIRGKWIETILWEVPLMSAVSQAYFETVDTDWNYDGQEERAFEKGRRLLQHDCVFSEFGSRRRRSLRTQDLVMQGLVRASEGCEGTKGRLAGTSNVYLAQKYGLKPVGTIAHEWFMGIAAHTGYIGHANKALSLWEETYGSHKNLLISLTDTFTSPVFFNASTSPSSPILLLTAKQEFSASPTRAQKWIALRQDSGDPFLFAPRAKEAYDRLGVDTSEKGIVYSDGLSVDLCLKLRDHCEEVGFWPSFGIGTHFTNDFRTASSDGNDKSKALNIVIKLSTIDGKPCVKLSDEVGKNTGDQNAVNAVKDVLGIA